MGDSITAGGYPADLGKLLGDGYEVRNLGVSGATLMKKGDLPYWNQGKIEEAEQFRPHIVTILLGANDAKPQNWQHKDTFLSDYKTLVATLRRLPGKPTVYVVIPAPVFGNAPFGINGDVPRKEITPLVEKAAKDTGVGTIDLYESLVHTPNLLFDGVHPSAEGN